MNIQSEDMWFGAADPRREGITASECRCSTPRWRSAATLSYTADRHITFYQTEADIKPWVCTQRVSIYGQIGVEHLLASAAIPRIFLAVPIF